MSDGAFQTLFSAEKESQWSWAYLNLEPIWSDRMVCETIEVMALQGVCLSLVMFSYCQEREEFVLTISHNHYSIKLSKKLLRDLN